MEDLDSTENLLENTSESNNSIPMINKPYCENSVNPHNETNNYGGFENNMSGYNNTNNVSYNQISNDEYRVGEEEPVPNSSVETHLESNLNVIENQNNENLERDNELSQPGENDNESNPENPEVEANNDDCDTNDNVADSAQDFFDDEEQDTASSKPEKLFNNQEIDSIERPAERPQSSADLDSSESTNKLAEETQQSIRPEERTESSLVLDSCDSANKLGEETQESNPESNIDSIEKIVNEAESLEKIATEAKSTEVDSVKEVDSEAQSEAQVEPSDLSKSSENSKNNLDSTVSDSEKPQNTEGELDSTLDLNAIDDIPREPLLESPEKNAEKSSESSKQTDENIEFAHVNFYSHEKESEHETEKDTSTTNKDLEFDPIASDHAETADSSTVHSDSQSNRATNQSSSSSHPEEVESVQERAGADEDLTIIPDTEREITQAEKDAASSIRPLKELSDYPPALATIDSSDIGVEKVGKEPPAPELVIQPYLSGENESYECAECKQTKEAKFSFKSKASEDTQYLCNSDCVKAYKEKNIPSKPQADQIRVRDLSDKASKPDTPSFVRTCASCQKVTDDIENNLTWEIMDFCNEFCLSKYQKVIGSKCASCKGDVKPASLGKYCVRFGNDIRQFCTSSCLEEYKKGLKVCSYCQQDMSNRPDGFLAPVGERGQFKDFCSRLCMEKYDIMTNDRPPDVEPGTKCSVCSADKQITIEFEHNETPHYFCGEPCFVAFSFVNQLSAGKCAMCRRHFKKSILEENTMYYDNVQYSFCSNSCKNIYIIAHRKIVPCSWCKVKKYNFDMIKKYGKTTAVINMCSINCLSLYKVSLSVINSKASACNFCQKTEHAAYHLTMSDASVRNFCSYTCVMSFQNQFPKQSSLVLNNENEVVPVPLGGPQKNTKDAEPVPGPINDANQMPVIANVQSLALASTNGVMTPPPLITPTLPPTLPPSLTPISTSRLTRSKKTPSTPATPVPQLPTTIPLGSLPHNLLDVSSQVKHHFIIKPPKPPEQRNAATQAQPKKDVKAIQTTPDVTSTGMQTEKEEISRILIPVPIPIYIPTPCHMFSTPVPIPVPFPLPIPIPIFIPTTRNSAQGIMKEIKKIQVKIPTDPYEAELLMMAEMVAEEKKEDHTDSESDLDDGGAEDNYSPEPVDSSNTFGDDMLQIALKMATELDEPAVDLEGALTANTITAPQGGHQEPQHQEEHVDDPQPMHPHMNPMRGGAGRKRSMRGAGTPRGQSKRGRRMSHQQVDMPMHQQMQQPPPPPEPVEKPDANMCLKYTFGVNAWKQWVTTKNAELEKSSRRMKLFKTEILQLTADELNYSLCLFVKEVRKPNGQEYAPDTIYYLCLGIQQYLFENGRIDNIFCDPYYEKFTDCLDEVAKKFSVLYNDSHYIVTRVEEEHLWESKQLGAHSPHVLLSTLMFFNTKHFNLTSVDEHMQLSFSHIMKHWKRNPNQPGAAKVPGSRNVLLRFYPPQSAIQNNQRKKKVYEQQENEENPLRCPVKLYEFYLSKCPESVKTRNDVFYLQPERSCVPDSPVWYSTMPLPKEALEKMLHRVKMVKEINVALLTS